MVEESLVDYEDKNSAKELLQGLKFGFKLNYSGPKKTLFFEEFKEYPAFSRGGS